MDRWDQEARRPNPLPNSLQPAAARQHLERDQHQTRKRASETKTTASTRIESVRCADRKQIRDLLVRTTPGRIAGTLLQTDEEEQSGLALFPSTTAVVSQNGELVYRQRKERRNAVAASKESDRSISDGKTALIRLIRVIRGWDQSLPKRSSSTPRRTSSTRTGAAKKL